MSEELFRRLIEDVKGYAIIMLDTQGRIVSWNLGAERIRGYRPEEIIGKHFSIFYPEEEIQAGRPDRALEATVAEGRFEEEGWRVRKDGSRFWASVVITSLYDPKGQIRGFSHVARDATGQKITQDRLKESEFKFRSIAESANQGIITIDGAGNICSWNRAAEAMFGHPEREVLGKPVTMIMPVRYQADHSSGIRRLLFAGEHTEPGRTVELHGLRKDGAEFQMELSLSSWQADQRTFFTGIISDISLRRKAEESLRRLTGLLLRIQDEERRRLARELHDSTAQTLSALSLNLALVKRCADTANQPSVDRAISESIDLADQASHELRTFSYLLHPPLLDEAGLADALRWYVDGFVQRTKIQVELAITPSKPRRLDPDIEMALFRVAQESLTNVYRHSGSPKAGVRLALGPRKISLEVWDEGKGLPAGVAILDDDSPAVLGVGIRGMWERVKQLGGEMQVRPANPGTRVNVVLPYHQDSHPPSEVE